MSNPQILSLGLRYKSNHIDNHIYSCFLPFAGCPQRCVFCNQIAQSGQHSDLFDLKNILSVFKKNILQAGSNSLELAFYGGTFTSLPLADQTQCLELVNELKVLGIKVLRTRCSTRPDSVNILELQRLKNMGLDLVELGVQSFNSEALNLARRGYNHEIAMAGCKEVQAAGLDLGIQLLPGMPGLSPEVFLADVEQALDLQPVCLRFYPCLVIKKTELANLWQSQAYAPWDLQTTVQTLGLALSKAWERKIPVIRLSLAPEPSLLEALLAGPYHPRLGSMIQRAALVITLQQLVAKYGKLKALDLPKACQGFAFAGSGLEGEDPRTPWELVNLPKAQVKFVDSELGQVWV